MKKILVIGSAVADVIITVDHLPVRQEDVNVSSQEMRLGGCAYNTFDMIRHFRVPAIPFFPIGTGAFGDFVGKELDRRGVTSAAPEAEEENGCCYCFVEPDGERTFISYHGAEYQFKKEWLDALDMEDIDKVYICGLEVEDVSGPDIVSFLEGHRNLQVFFAPGPRLASIDPALMKRIFALRPVLHLNDEEACSYTSCENVPAACRRLCQLTDNTVLVTLGSRGSAYDDGTHFEEVPARPLTPVDTIGAGDAHIGAVLAARSLGYEWKDCLRIANQASAGIICVKGATMTDAAFRRCNPLGALNTPPAAG